MQGYLYNKKPAPQEAGAGDEVEVFGSHLLNETQG